MFRRLISLLLSVIFCLTMIIPSGHAQQAGGMLGLSPALRPSLLEGLKVDPAHPFRFQFLLSAGEDDPKAARDFDRLVRYFFTALTVPEKNVWVNLSPLEHDRIVEESFGRTPMGRDLLAMDYVLKQLSASLMYPEDETGRCFWQEVYARARSIGISSEIPTDVFNKIWVVSGKAKVLEQSGTVYITGDELDVMTDSDHALAASSAPSTVDDPSRELAQRLIREIILPVLKKEINEGAHFAPLRQIHRAMILATWYKKRLKDSLLAQVYAQQNKLEGNTHNDPEIVEQIYARYLEAYKQGVFDYIKEELDDASGELVPHRYLAGGMDINVHLEYDLAEKVSWPERPFFVGTVDAVPVSSTDHQKAFFSRSLKESLSKRVRQLFALAALPAFLAFSGVDAVARDSRASMFNAGMSKALLWEQALETKLSPSHFNMPDLPAIAITYDVALSAGVLKATGQETYARTLMDVFNKGLNNPLFAKRYKSSRGFMNTVNVRTGNTTVEYYITPGPNAWIGLAALLTDARQYLSLAESEGDFLIVLQNSDGGVTDGDRKPGVVDTEPHMDAISLFQELYKTTENPRWLEPLKKSKEFFYTRLYNKEKGWIVQGTGSSPDLFATDVFSWPLSGFLGEEVSLQELKVLIDTMLTKSLVRVEAPVPGGEMKVITLVDFTDPLSAHAIAARGGIHPLGSTEWTSGVVLALQKAAVRFAAEGDMPSAGFYKALAEKLLAEAARTFRSHEDGRMYAFYATEAGVQTGHGWKTPYPADQVKGSVAGYWILFPMERVSPFDGKYFGDEYDKIDAKGYADTVLRYLDEAVKGRTYSVPRQALVDMPRALPEPSSPVKKDVKPAEDQPWWKKIIASESDPAEGYGGIDLQQINLTVDSQGTKTIVGASESDVLVLREQWQGIAPRAVSLVPLSNARVFVLGK